MHHSWPDNRGGIVLPVDRQLLIAKEKNLGDSEAKPLHCHSPTSSDRKESHTDLALSSAAWRLEAINSDLARC